MTTVLDQLAYRASQRLRLSWYFGQKWLSAQLTRPVPVPLELRRRLPTTARLRRDLEALIEADWRNVAEGRYLRPEASVDGPREALRKARRYFADLPRVEARRRRTAHQEVLASQPRGRYPRYYLQNFHYQTDGYLSSRSAELYDQQVEVLFGGAADAMRRQALVPVGRVLAERGVRRATLLDLACGTGRFLREVKANYPKLAVIGLDLSPYYLEEAGKRLAPWSGVDLVAAPAEAAPLPDASVDVVTCIYLLHELPAKQRRAVAGEIARLLKPDGAAILVDSLQLGDEPDYDALIEYFPRAFHEPYYAGYAREDLTALFAAAGLELEASWRAYFSKVTTFRKRA